MTDYTLDLETKTVTLNNAIAEELLKLADWFDSGCYGNVAFKLRERAKEIRNA